MVVTHESGPQTILRCASGSCFYTDQATLPGIFTCQELELQPRSITYYMDCDGKSLKIICHYQHCLETPGYEKFSSTPNMTVFRS